MNKKFIKLWKDNKSILFFLCLMFVFRSAVADWNEVPTGSMKPTIVEGDRILVNKMVYDLRVPFTHISLFKLSDPVVGDIIIFDSKISDKRLVKRVVGVPGDIVEMRNNVLWVNGQKLSYHIISKNLQSTDKIENLSGVKHQIRVKLSASSRSSFEPVKVPQDYYLVLGDNRDNSADSRFIGFVPRNEIVGRSQNVVMSLDYDNYYLPRSERFLHTL